jgi:hypothetical protein
MKGQTILQATSYRRNLWRLQFDDEPAKKRTSVETAHVASPADNDSYRALFLGLTGDPTGGKAARAKLGRRDLLGFTVGRVGVDISPLGVISVEIGVISNHHS